MYGRVGQIHGLGWGTSSNRQGDLIAVTPLMFAAFRGSTDLARVLLQAGASTRDRLNSGQSLLVLSVLGATPGSSTELLQLLLERGAAIDHLEPPWSQSALQAAAMTGDMHLMKFLVSTGANLNYRATDRHDIAGVFDHIDDVGVLGYAASFSRAPPWNEPQLEYERANFEADQEIALGLCREIVRSYGSQMNFSSRKTTDATVIAAARGYTKVISLLHDNLTADINLANGQLTPLYAAVAWEQVETARLLLDLGASVNVAPPPFHYKDHIYSTPYSVPAPSLLHVAIGRRSLDLARLLLQRGAEVDELSEVDLDDSSGTISLEWPPPKICRLESEIITVTALQLSIMLGDGPDARFLGSNCYRRRSLVCRKGRTTTSHRAAR